MYTYIAVDTLNIAHRLFDKNDKSLCRISNKTVYLNLVKDFIEIVRFWQKKFLSNDGNFFFLFDNPTSRDQLRGMFEPLNAGSSRKEKFPEYKSNRIAMPKEFYNSVDLIKWYYMMSDPKYACARINHVEADDLVKPFIEFARRDADARKIPYRALLVTNDSDWCRFLDEDTDYLPQLYEESRNYKDFRQQYGYFPSEEYIVLYKIVHGDKADNIKSAFPELDSDRKKIITDTCSSISELYTKLNEMSFTKQEKIYIRDQEKQAKIAFQMVSLIPISLEHFEASVVRGRNSASYRNTLESLLFTKASHNEFQFGFLQHPRVDPKE